MYRSELDLAEDVLIAYESHMQDFVHKGHCHSIEWRYQKNKYVSTAHPTHAKFPPEVYDMVQKVMHILCVNHRPVWAVLMLKYSKVSPFYKRQTQATMRKNQKKRYSSKEWAYEIEYGLLIFWQQMKKQPNFTKYFENYY